MKIKCQISHAIACTSQVLLSDLHLGWDIVRTWLKISSGYNLMESLAGYSSEDRTAGRTQYWTVLFLTWVCERVWVLQSHNFIHVGTALFLHNAAPDHDFIHSILGSPEVSCDVHKRLQAPTCRLTEQTLGDTAAGES